MGKHTLLLATTKAARGRGGCQEQSDTLPLGKKACIWFCYRYQVATTPKAAILTSLVISQDITRYHKICVIFRCFDSPSNVSCSGTGRLVWI